MTEQFDDKWFQAEVTKQSMNAACDPNLWVGEAAKAQACRFCGAVPIVGRHTTCDWCGGVVCGSCAIQYADGVFCPECFRGGAE